MSSNKSLRLFDPSSIIKLLSKKRFKYDVFISFWGEDTRKTFVDDLYQALKQKGLETYKDDEEMKQGKTSNKSLRFSDPSSITSSAIPKRFKYDVFISFWGEDTRKTFVDDLYQALKQKGLETYKDDEEMKQGKTIDNQLIQAIKDSRFFIIVFSKNYASSSWCLDELVEIMECQKTGEQTAYPVFFHVEPTQVRKQSGAFGEAFLQNKNKDAAGKWIEALKGASNLVGWELQATANGHEAEFIKKIVGEISLELRSISFGFDEKLVGMETRVKHVIDSLEMGIDDDVWMIGIKGMGGAGKTTTARAVFDRLSADFEAKSFVANVREVSESSMSGLKKLQKQVLSDVMKEKVTVNDVTHGKNMMQERMRDIKVLLVLDDVNHIDQLEALAKPNWFKPGSRIIITTRDEQVLVAHRVNLIRDIDLLSDKEAICLFSRYAFGREIPSQGFEELSLRVVLYAAGLPLTLKVLGSFLSGKDEHEWKDAIERLKEIPLKETQEKLELSYTSLEKDYKEIFLDIACILKGVHKEEAIRILECCGFHAINGLKVLEQRSLITISKGGFLGMHDHIEEMGKNIVRREHPNEPNKHSRLWIKEEIEDILTNDEGTEATICLELFEPNTNVGTVMKGLGKMKQLRYLQVYFQDQDYAEVLDNTAQYFSNSLKYLKCSDFPFLYLPKTFQANNLVGLEMLESRMVQLWEEGEKKVLPKLKFLSLSGPNLKTFDFRITPNLETLSLINSRNLVELFMPVSCLKLNYLRISFSKLRTFDLGLTPNLEKLSLNDCADFEELHVSSSCQNLKFLELCNSRLRSLDLELFLNLEWLDLRGCVDFEELHVSSACPNLKFLELGESRLRSLDLELFLNLELLELKGCVYFEDLHVSSACPSLKFLELGESRLRSLDLELFLNLEWLGLEGCAYFEELHVSSACPNLKSLKLCKSRLRSLDLELFPNLERLDLEGCADFKELHVSSACPNLKFLELGESRLRSLDLEMFPNLEMLDLEGCADFEELHVSSACPNLKFLGLGKSRLRSLNLKLFLNLEWLDLEGCADFEELNVSSACPNLKFLNLCKSRLRSLDLELFPNLERLDLEGCADFEELHVSSACPNLKFLELGESRLRSLDLELFPNLENLDLKGCVDFEELRYLQGMKMSSSSSSEPKEGKQMEEQIVKEVEFLILIHALKEIPEVTLQKDDSRRSRRRLKRKHAADFAKKTRRERRGLARLWKELVILKQKSEQKQVDKRWSVQQEVENLFNVALKFSYGEFNEKPNIITCVEEEYGDYQCENVLSIWPKLREEGTMHLGPRRVGWKIKKILELLRPEMIERTPLVLDAGVVAIKLSGKWMAKSVHKMLRDGIDTWAPKFVMERVIINFPSCDMANLVPMDLLRRELIKTTSISMLKYCKIDVEFSMPCGKDLPTEENDKFQIIKRDNGDVLIFRNYAEGEQEPLIHAKRDEWSGIKPMDDLADLWYGLEEKKADWIVCVTPVHQQEYIKMCIKAAQHAEWLPLHICDSPRASYTGYQIFNTKLKHEDLDWLLDEAEISCKAAAEVLGYTGEQVSNCALKYTILKNNRLADYTFSYEEMLNAEGNTFVYLLNTQFRIRSFTKESREDIDQLKKDSELTLGKGEIWKEGVERVLVQKLLGFTKVIVRACLPVLPHILCEYLYDVSKSFNAVCEVGFVAKTTKLLLCEATGVVMEKGFQLLGITPESSSLGVVDSLSSGLTKSLLQVERLNHKDDPPKINTRFEMFTIYPYITRDRDVTEAVMFGTILISDGHSVRWDGWGLTNAPDHGFVGLFDSDGPYSVDITSGLPMYLGNPTSWYLVPLSSNMETCVELYARTEWNDDLFELAKGCFDTDLKGFLEDEEADTSRCLWTSSGQDGYVQMFYILLKDAVDCAIKVTYDGSTKDGGEVFAEIFAYYGGDFFKKGDPFEKKFYTACLFRNRLDLNIPEIPLERSMLAVPANGSIVIEATLFGVDSWDMIMSGGCTFLAQSTDSVQTISGSCGSFRVSVDWSRG